MTHKNNLFLIFGPLKFEKKIAQSFFSKIKWPSFPKEIKSFFVVVVALQNRLDLKSPLKKTALYDST